MKKIIVFFFILSIISCNKQNNTEEKVNEPSVSNSKNSIDYIGTYKGILPCADCEGLETEIVINENETYRIKTRYQGKGNKYFIKKGNFTWDKKGIIIILSNVENAPKYYLVGKNTLTQLDLEGQKISGSLANDYILSKQPTDTALETSIDNNATVDLNNRIQTTTVIKKVNPAVGKYALAETKWKLVSLYNTKVLAQGKKEYFLKINSKDARFTAFAGCNNITGNYIMPSSNTIDFSDVIMTRMACADMTLEDKFGAMLVQVKRYKINNELLTFYGDGKKVVAQFQALK
jgi:copper homeostasis protein (lipoprotein)